MQNITKLTYTIDELSARGCRGDTFYWRAMYIDLHRHPYNVVALPYECVIALS